MVSRGRRCTYGMMFVSGRGFSVYVSALGLRVAPSFWYENRESKGRGRSFGYTLTHRISFFNEG